jgi:integrase
LGNCHWILGAPGGRTRIAELQLHEILETDVLDWREEITEAGVWLTARPRRGTSQGPPPVLRPRVECPFCDREAVVERPRSGRWRSCPTVRERVCLHCGATSLQRLATIGIYRNALRVLSRILNRAARAKLIELPNGLNPCVGLPRPQVRTTAAPGGMAPSRRAEKRLCSPFEIQLLRSLMPDEEDELILDLISVGMHRPGDAGRAHYGSLAYRSINPVLGTAAWAFRFRRGKNEVESLVEVPEVVAKQFLEARRRMGQSAESAIAPKIEGKDAWNRWRKRIFEPAARIAGLGGVRPYDLRMCISCYRRASGEEEGKIAKQCGHTVEIMREYYTGAGFDVAYQAPPKPLAEAIERDRPLADRAAIELLRAERDELLGELRSSFATIERLRAEGASVRMLARETGEGRKWSARLLAEATSLSALAAMRRYSREQPVAERLDQIARALDRLEVRLARRAEGAIGVGPDHERTSGRPQNAQSRS